jgi:nitrogen regulatory protein P-II 1
VKEIKAIIRPSKLESVLEALQSVKNLPGCIVSQVQGYGRSAGMSVDAPMEPAEFAKLEIVVDDRLVKKVVMAIVGNARTGNPGDGKVFIIECPDAVWIRTGKSGKAAL